MEYRGININIVLIIIAGILIVYFAGQFFLARYNVEKPLVNNIRDISGIREVSLTENGSKTDIEIVLNQDADLYNIYLQINELTEEKLGESKGQIIINNENNKVNRLENAYYRAHYAIYEGIATRHFQKMKESVERIITDSGVEDYRLWIDSNNIYLQLVDNKGSLFKIIPRQGTVRGGEDIG